MKLRNKKTGKVWETPKDRWPTVQQDDISFFAAYGLEGHLFSYKTLAELNEEWEDYEPAEPLIKDEKIRKAVRAWAEVLNIEGVSIEHRCAGELCEVHSVFCGLSMEFDGSIMSDIQDGDYTIAELCGEEEE